jgi:thiol-disulfide isomerase/thioredoxin
MRRVLIFLAFFISSVLVGGLDAAERNGPVRIGVLTEGFGPTSGAVGLRDGLKTLGYREDKDFVIGVRFTQGDTAALPAAVRELIQRRVDILFTTGRDTARAAQTETTKVPIVFGKVIILNFWATWCQECFEEMPAFEQLHRKFAGQGLTVIGINAREGTPAIQKYGLNFPANFGPKGRD